MNFNLKHEGFESNLIEAKRCYDGVQYVFRFANDYGASVVKHRGSYGYHSDLWELAVIKFNSEDNEDWNLIYTTPITDDVIGFRTDEEIRDLLKQIKELN